MLSIIEKAMQYLAKYNKGLFRAVDKVVIVAADSEKCVAELKIEEEHINPQGTLHGGFAATLVDVMSNVGLRPLTGDKAHVSVSMNLSYLKTAKLGDEIVIESETLKAGRTLAFLLITIKNKQTDDLLVKCSHTISITSLKFRTN